MSDTENNIAKDLVFMTALDFAASKNIDLKKSMNELSDIDKCYMLSIADFALFCLMTIRDSRDVIKEAINNELLEDITNYMYNISNKDNAENYSLYYINNKLKRADDEDAVDMPTIHNLMDIANKEFKTFIVKHAGIFSDKADDVTLIAGKNCASKLLTALRLDLQGFMRGFADELSANEKVETPDFLMFFNTDTSFIICGNSTPVSTMRFITDVMVSFGERFNNDNKAENISQMIASIVPPVFASLGLSSEDCKIQDMLSESFADYDRICKQHIDYAGENADTNNK